MCCLKVLHFDDKTDVSSCLDWLPSSRPVYSCTTACLHPAAPHKHADVLIGRSASSCDIHLTLAESDLEEDALFVTRRV